MMQRLIEKIEAQGWTVDKDDTGYLIGKYSPAGQDFSVVVEAGKDADDFIDNLKEVYEDFDVSAEAYLWLDDTGHGRRGAPYDMKAVYEDMQACESMMWQLWESLNSERL